MNALDVLCAQLTRDLFAVAKFLLFSFKFSVVVYIFHFTAVFFLLLCCDLA